jgi:hypothetical protein
VKRVFCDLCGVETKSYVTYSATSTEVPTFHLCSPKAYLRDVSKEPPRDCVKALQDFLAAPREKEPA